MRLTDGGEVFGHFVIPYIDDEMARKALAKAVADYPGIKRAEFASIAGECDILLHLYLNDFRVIADLQAEVTDSYSLASSWLYAIPYEGSDAAMPSKGDLEFFIYMRVHRHFYKCYGTAGERVLHDAVLGQLRDTGGEELSGRVLYSVGWPDLIVHGKVTGDIQHLRRLIVSLQSLSFPTKPAVGSEQPEGVASVFLKTITVIGVPMSPVGDQGIRLAAPVLFGRNRPGMTADAIRALRRVFEQGSGGTVRSWTVDGTWDFVVTSTTEEPLSLARFHGAIRDSRVGFASHGIERTQTHLLTSLEADLELLEVPPVTLRPQAAGALLPDRCACGQEVFDKQRRLLEIAKKSGYLPKQLTRTISHALSMFQHTLREPSNCCDSVGALRAHAQGLEVLLKRSLHEQELLKKTTNSDRQALIANEISLINSHLAEWCKRSGRVVREKTAGSAARLFLQIDSIVAQRGAIPKMLMICERIMEQFYAQLPQELPRFQAVPGRRFAAILEPTGNVTSQALMGLIAIPIRYAFALHLVVPQLWHEVGQYVFWAEYSPAQRLRVDWDLCRGSEDPATTTSRRQAVAFSVDYELRADMFADLLVFSFGFGGSLVKFVRYLGSLTANVAKHDRLHPQSWARQALALVHRLCFVAQFAAVQRRAKREAPPTREKFDKLCEMIEDAWFVDRLEAQQLVRNMIHHLLRVSTRQGWPEGFRIPPHLAPTVAKNFRSEVYGLCFQDLKELAYAFRNLTLDGRTAQLNPSDWEQIEKGELIDLPSGESLLTAYREFYLEEVEAQLAGADRPRRDGRFRKMATLGRSALLHIYQSETVEI